MSEKEMLELKEQLKQEILKEIDNKKKNQNNWNKLKKELKEEIEQFNYINHWKFTDPTTGEIKSSDNEVIVEYQLQNAIATFLKVIYKVKTIAKINANYEDMKSITVQLLNVLKLNMKLNEGK